MTRASAIVAVRRECRRPWLDEGRGWEAYRVDLDEVALYCPECAELEFGEPTE